MQNKIIKTFFLLAIFFMAPNCTRAAEKLLHQSDLDYLGAFRVPVGNLGLVNPPKSNILSYGGAGLGYVAERNTLLMSGGTTAGSYIVEVNIPQPKIDNNIGILNVATISQTPVNLIYPNEWALGQNGQNVPGYGYNSGCTAAGAPWDCCTGLQTGTCANSGSSQAQIAGFISYNGRAIGSVTQSYAKSAYKSHYTFNLNRAGGNNFQGFYQVGTMPFSLPGRTAPFVGGYMGLIPSQWQVAFGGAMLTGNAAQSMISETSSGPSAWVFNPDDLGVQMEPISATMLLGYPSGHNTLGLYDAADGIPQKYFHQGSTYNGVVFPSNTDSILFFGKYGYGRNSDGSIANGVNCYGAGTSQIAQIKTKQEVSAWLAIPGNLTSPEHCLADGITDGVTCGGGCATGGNACCYDLSYNMGSKGPHTDPLVYRVMAYDANQMLRVKNGDTIKDSNDLATFTIDGLNPTLNVGDILKPWNLIPYDMWDLSLPFSPIDGKRSIGGIAYDPSTQKIYVAQLEGDKPGLEPFPVIHVFQVNASIVNDALAPAAPSGLSVL